MDELMRFGLISPYTGGNLGDAAIIESARRQLIDRFGNAELILLVLDPLTVGELHGLNTFPLSGLRRDFYFTPVEALGGDESEGHPLSRSGMQPLKHRLRAGLKRIGGSIPLALPVAGRIRDGFRKLTIEVRHIVDARRIVRELDCLLIAGGGQFDDEFGGPWGHPYSLYKWVRLAHSRKVPVFMAGVGVDDLRRLLSCWFLRHTLAIARRVSLRDPGSMEALRKMGIDRQLQLCPDLAFGLSRCTGESPPDDDRSGRPPRIGLSPIAYGRSGSWPTVAESSFDRYWREFQSLTRLLIEANYSIDIFATDEPDYHLARILYDQVSKCSGAEGRVQLLPRVKAADLLSLLRGFDVVVASRLHGVLLSHVCMTPALAISYRRKVRAQMADMGQEQFCLDFQTFTADQALESLKTILKCRTQLAADLYRTCRERHKAVVDEFRAICADLELNSAES